jgi:phosphate butyryltransferase
METIQSFTQLTDHLKAHSGRKLVALVCGYDEHSFAAVKRAVREGLADFILVGDQSRYGQYVENEQLSRHITIVHELDSDKAARIAIELVRKSEADILMKGIINTDNLLRAILDKETGLLPHGRVLTHLSVMHIPTYHKLLFFSDAAVVPYPTQEQRVEMIRYAVEVCHRFGIEKPRVSLIHCTEKVNPKFPVTTDYVNIVKMCADGEFGNAIVDGPLDVRVSCDKESMEVKGIHSPIDGDADVLLFSDIEAANSFYKAVTLFAHAEIAGMLMGPICPVVLPSRSDSARTKFYSLAMALLNVGLKKDSNKD